MGEMADYYLDQEMNDEFFDNAMFEEECGHVLLYKPRKIVRCKFCNAGPLEWIKMFDKWVLAEYGKLHECEKYKLDLKKME